MFFFIAGVQPKTIDLDEQPRMCPSCGLYQASLKRVDHYISIFFLPILRIKKGSPFLQCQRCESLHQESGESWRRYQERDPCCTCTHCGKPIEQGYHFCPFCGKKV